VSLLRRSARPVAAPVEVRASGTEPLFQRRLGVSSSFGAVGPEMAHRQSTAWACQRLLADSVRQLPIDWFALRLGEKMEIEPPIWSRKPEPGVRWSQFVDRLIMDLCDYGNAVFRASMGPSRFPDALVRLDPRRVEINTRDGVAYSYAGKPLDMSTVWHVQWAPGDTPWWGIGPLEVAARSLGVADACRTYVAEFFASGGHPTMELIVNNDLDYTDTDMVEVKERVMAVLAGSREPWVHDSMIEAKQWQLSPTDAAFLEVVSATDVDICRFYGVRSPEFIQVAMGGSSITYANLEQRLTALSQLTLGPLIRSLEEALSDDMLTQPGTYAKFNMGLFLRGDAITQAKVIDMQLRNGTLSQDEAREIQDRPPVVDGSRYVWPPGNTTEPDDPLAALSPNELATMVQKIYLGVGKVLTEEEARDLLHDAGASFSGPLPTNGDPNAA
jgi:HK97 family phage portal protein